MCADLYSFSVSQLTFGLKPIQLEYLYIIEQITILRDKVAILPSDSRKYFSLTLALPTRTQIKYRSNVKR